MPAPQYEAFRFQRPEGIIEGSELRCPAGPSGAAAAPPTSLCSDRSVRFGSGRRRSCCGEGGGLDGGGGGNSILMTLGPQKSSATASLRNLDRSCAKAAAASIRNSSSGSLLLNALRARPQGFSTRLTEGKWPEKGCVQALLASRWANKSEVEPADEFGTVRGAGRA